MRSARWKLLGHILRRDQNIPANMAMTLYFNEKHQGRNKIQGGKENNTTNSTKQRLGKDTSHGPQLLQTTQTSQRTRSHHTTELSDRPKVPAATGLPGDVCWAGRVTCR